MKILFIVFVVVIVLAFIVNILDRILHIGIFWRGPIIRWKYTKEGPFPIAELAKDQLPTAVCVDLGAFHKPLQKIPEWIEVVVLMSDRLPRLLLTYKEFCPNDPAHLSKHGPLNECSTQGDLRDLVQSLHQQGKRAFFGSWCFWGDLASGQPFQWLMNHPELRKTGRTESQIGNPFAFIRPEKVTFPEYVARQYRLLQKDFGFDGFFLGDGFSGFVNFMFPGKHKDKDNTAKQWANLYRIIADEVHQTSGELWAYDCLGLNANEARLHGADYRLFAKARLDVLVFQSYPTAWADYFKVKGKTGLLQDCLNFDSVRECLKGTKTGLYYTLEYGDSVEGWRPAHSSVRGQMKTFCLEANSHLADGKLIVWGNDLLSQW
jgi:hypothetical protein